MKHTQLSSADDLFVEAFFSLAYLEAGEGCARLLPLRRRSGLVGVANTPRGDRQTCVFGKKLNDSAWMAAVQTALEKAGATQRVTMKYIPFDFDQAAHFASSAYCQALNDGSWDVVIIDGQDKTFRERITCFRQAEPLMQPGTIILVDDFWRYEELLGSNRARNVRVFESVGPCRIGVTSTAMFFY